MSFSADKLLITDYHDKILTLRFEGGRLTEANADPAGGSLLNQIYLGKVQSIVKNIDAAFIEISPGKVCFMPLREAKYARLANRAPDGRLLCGDQFPVQVVREASKLKQPSVSADLSLAGSFCAVTSGTRKLGFSAKLSKEKKNEIRLFLQEHDVWKDVSQNFGVIIRTAAENLDSYEPLAAEAARLSQMLIEVLKSAEYRTCFSLLKGAEPKYFARIKQFAPGGQGEIVTDIPSVYDESAVLLKSIPSACPLRLYTDPQFGLKKLYSVETRLKEALSKHVYLKSGGYLIIEPTEALTVIDVNSGKYDKKKIAKETYYNVNLEAAREIALQIKLRNLSGIIIVDFINMEDPGQNMQLLHELKHYCGRDSIKTAVVDITALGLVEITRKKVDGTLAEQLFCKEDSYL